MRPEISPTLRVLVVEDERLIRWALTQALGDAGAAVVEASDAHSAIAALRDEGEGFDVAVLDVNLPGDDGLDVLAALHGVFPATRVLMITAFGSPELRAEACGLGAACVIDKPFDLDVMTGLVFGRALPAGTSPARPAPA